MFDVSQGVNFSSNALSAPELARALCRTVSFIQSIENYRVELERYDDWWEHDGLHFHKGPLSISELFGLVESPRSLLAAMQGDERVFTGVASDSRLWYLRFYLSWEDEGFDLSGRFDITLPAGIAANFRKWMLGFPDMNEQDSEAYYNKIRS